MAKMCPRPMPSGTPEFDLNNYEAFHLFGSVQIMWLFGGKKIFSRVNTQPPAKAHN